MVLAIDRGVYDMSMNRPVNKADVYYLLQLFFPLKVWNAFDFSKPKSYTEIQIPGQSPHFRIVDGGSCFIMHPRELFSHERTQLDGIQTAKALASFIHSKMWTVEMAGFEKGQRAFWVQWQHNNIQKDAEYEILRYNPKKQDLDVYHNEAEAIFNGTLSWEFNQPNSLEPTSAA